MFDTVEQYCTVQVLYSYVMFYLNIIILLRVNSKLLLFLIVILLPISNTVVELFFLFHITYNNIL